MEEIIRYIEKFGLQFRLERRANWYSDDKRWEAVIWGDNDGLTIRVVGEAYTHFAACQKALDKLQASGFRIEQIIEGNLLPAPESIDDTPF